MDRKLAKLSLARGWGIFAHDSEAAAEIAKESKDEEVGAWLTRFADKDWERHVELLEYLTSERPESTAHHLKATEKRARDEAEGEGFLQGH